MLPSTRASAAVACAGPLTRRRTTARVLLCWAVIGCVVDPATAAAQSNRLIDLGEGYGWGLNDSGQAVLKLPPYSMGGFQSAGLYSNGTITPLPLTESLSINASGAVAGTNTANHAAVYSNGTLTDLGVLPGSNAGGPFGIYSQAAAINSSGLVVGLASNGAQIDAFSYSNGTMTDIGYLPDATGSYAPIFSEAFGVNDSGQITGLSLGADGYCHAFLYQNASMTDLGVGVGNAINASGQLTGIIATPQTVGSGCPPAGHAFLYAKATVTDLGVLPGGSNSGGYAINAAGYVVGFSDVGVVGGGGNTNHAIISSGSTLTDLNALIDAADPLKPYVTLVDARGINVNRLVLANGVDSRSPQLTHVYLLQAPWIADVAPGALSFASQAVGTESPPQSVTLTNSSPSTLSLGNASVTGDFAQSSNCGATLNAGHSCVISVTFSPTAAGNPTGTLTVVSSGVPSTIALAGIAPFSLSFSASVSSVTAGTPFTLSWNVTGGASCLATGGSPADGWTGSFSGSGSLSVTEAAAGNYLYGLNCSAGQQTAQAQAKVLVNYPMAGAASSGGGGLDLVTLLALLGLGATRALRYGKSNARVAAMRLTSTLALCLSCLWLGACGGEGGGGGGGGQYTVGGSISGLAGHGLVLGNNGANPLSASANGSFTFTAGVPNGAIYDVQVVTQPTGPSQTCSVAKGSGVINGGNVTNVAVTCTTNIYTVGGTVSGLSGAGLTLVDNGSNQLSVSANGPFTFGTGLPDGTSYNVTVTAQPSGPTQTCAVAKGTGTLNGGNVTSVQLTCTTNSYSVGGTVSGLVGTGLTLSLDGGAPIPISSDGPFQFPGTLLSGANFSVAAAVQPSGPFQSCLATDGSGTVGGSDVSVSVICTTISAFAYINDRSAGLVGYSVAAQTGFLTQLPGTSFTNPTATAPTNIVASPDGKKLYITEGGTIYAYSIAQPPSAQMGTLSLVGSTTIDPINGLATDTSGQFLYATAMPNTVGAQGYVAAFKSDAATGALSLIAKYASGSGPTSIAAYPKGNYLLVINLTSANVSVFTINSGAGTLAPVSGSPFATGPGPQGVAATPNGKFVYVTNDGISGSPGLSSYTIDSSTGILTPIPNGSGGTANLTTVAVDPSSQFLFVSGDIMYINQCLAIDPVSGVPTIPCPFGYPPSILPPASAFAEAYAVSAFDPSGHFMYVVDGIGTRVLQFSSNPAGLTWVQTINTSSYPNRIAIAAIK